MLTGKTEPIDMERSNVLYFELEGGRFIIRPSGTEPKLKSYLSASAAEKTEADSKLAQIKTAASALIDQLTK